MSGASLSFLGDIISRMISCPLDSYAFSAPSSKMFPDLWVAGTVLETYEMHLGTPQSLTLSFWPVVVSVRVPVYCKERCL